MRVILSNNQHVEVSQDEVNEFITCILIPNSYWRYSGQLTEEEVARFLKQEGTHHDLKRVARYLLTFIENLSFSAYLFDKAEGEPDRTREFNMPAIIKLRELYQKVKDSTQMSVEVSQAVWEMENICLEIGADPL